MPLRARRALRSTSRRTRSRIVCGLGTVGMALLRRLGATGRPATGAALLGLQLQAQPPDLAVQRADLGAQPADVAPGRQVDQVPGAGGQAPGRVRRPGVCARRTQRDADVEARRPHQVLGARGDGALGGVERLPPQRRCRAGLFADGSLPVGESSPSTSGSPPYPPGQVTYPTSWLRSWDDLDDGSHRELTARSWTCSGWTAGWRS